MRLAFAFTASLALATSSLAVSAAAQNVSPAISAAVADTQRPAADTARDVHRKPAQIVAFAGVKPGDKVAELMPGGGYYTRILARTVGPKGHIYALVPTGFANRPGGLDALNALAAQYGNVTVVPTDLANFKLDTPVDVVWTTENYHDFHNGPTANIPGLNAAAFAALKPGGVYFIEDHAAAAGAGTTTTSTLHRIDPAAVTSEVQAAGFKLDAQSTLLANPKDTHELGVRDPSIQGETDKLALRFKKPG
uniref:class I SAM-dependent methyltransferase n=1 Tax=Altererythrobacter segetis TaxID=1104773 RepID=UPI001A9CA7B8|nr:class I SAM-dependent methyltransferase [Altererythrobacter segetis]